MPKVKAQITISLDGYMAGPNQSEENPMGEGAMPIHEWAFNLRSWNEAHGREVDGDVENPSDAALEAATANIGAVVMGRNMFGPVRGDWPDEDWKGWWGDDPPFHCPVYVLTHHRRDPFELEGGNSFHFVTEGIEKAIAEAKEAADDQDVSIGGGASTIRQAVNAGLLDEVMLTVSPVFVGGGERPFDQLDPGVTPPELLDVVNGRDAVHLIYRLT
jgi:dihydrofolate reductase